MMTGFDDDPEYEAQLKLLLRADEHSPRPQTADSRSPDDGVEETGEFLNLSPDDNSVDDVLDDAPKFRIALPAQAKKQPDADDRNGAVEGAVLSEDARSISTGDDSPSIQVYP
jgi:hypothetical protein